jgi:predicted amidohydrolase YtcJ
MRNSNRCPRLLLIAGASIALQGLAQLASADGTGTADLVVLNSTIYTADASHHMASAMAVQGNRLVYVGDADGARAWAGPKTRILDAAGRLVLPGLVDSHIHPTSIVAWHNCDADDKVMDFAELSAFVRGCIERYHTPPGQWVSVRQWNYASGNRPTAKYPTMRAALDAATTQHPVHLLGDDGHHGAFNSLALAAARNKQGKVVGLSKATLETDFAAEKVNVGVDQQDEPNGMVNENTQYAIDGPDNYASDVEDLRNVIREPTRVTQRLNSVGITAMLDAAMPQNQLPFYDKLLALGQLTVRTRIAQYLVPDSFRDPSGKIDYPRMLDIAKATRTKYEGNPLIRADVVKLFVDGGLEGDPHASPPTLPNAASLHPYLQPKFALDGAGNPQVTGYVDTESQECQAYRSKVSAYQSRSAVSEFEAQHGFRPEQCHVSSGALYQPREELLEFVRQFHLNGFVLHMHVIGDLAARTAIDAIEAARAAGGPNLGRDGLAHLELVSPEDVARIGRDRIYIAFTYSWATVEPEYDLSVVPFIDHVTGNGAAALHPASGYYEKNAYPVRSVRDAGGLVVGGSDAAVSTRDPQPFVNIARAVTRRLPGKPALNPSESIPIRDAIDSYTIAGATFLGWDKEMGSLEAGKSADFVILDRNILELADRGDPESIEKTQVVETYFMGRRVYLRHSRK